MDSRLQANQWNDDGDGDDDDAYVPLNRRIRRKNWDQIRI